MININILFKIHKIHYNFNINIIIELFKNIKA